MAKAKNILKKKKKRWIPIFAPKMFNNSFIGETYIFSPESAVGRRFDVNLRDVGYNIRKHHLNLILRIEGKEEGRLGTRLEGYFINNTFLKRMVRRKQDTMVDSFVIEGSEGEKVRIKTFATTAFNTSRSKRHDLRARIKELITDNIKKNKFEDIISKIISREFQDSIKKDAKKIYPLGVFDIKYFALEK